MASVPADLEQGLGLGVRVQDALAALGLGKKGRELSVSPTARDKQQSPAGFKLATGGSVSYGCRAENTEGLRGPPRAAPRPRMPPLGGREVQRAQERLTAGPRN